MLENNFIAGLDPTPLGNISGAQLLQMINEALPSLKRGLIYFGTAAPDIISNPELIKYIWLDPSSFPIVPKLFNQNTSTWESWVNAPLSVSTAMLQDKSVTPAKIAPGASYQLLRTDSTGLFTEWWSLSFAANSIDVQSLQKGIGSNGDFLRIKTDGSGIEWFTYNFSDYLTVSSIPWNAIQNSGIPGDVLYVQDAQGNLSWIQVPDLILPGTFNINKLTTGTPNSYLRTNPGGNGTVWDDTNPASLITHGRDILTAGSGNYTVPGNVYFIDVEVVGPGGGGRTTQANGNSGASGGGYTRKFLSVTPGQVIPYVVGVGGTAANPGNAGSVDSSFNTTIIGNKGLGGNLATIAGGSYSGGDYGAEGYKGGTTTPSASELVSGSLPDPRYLAFTGGKSGHPLSKGGDVNVVPTFGGGGSSAQNGAGAAPFCAAQNGADGIIIITY